MLLIALTRRLPTGSWWWRSLVLGTLNIGAFFALLFIAAYRLPGGVAATVGAVQPLLVALLAAGLLGERLTPRTALAAAAGVAGVGLLLVPATLLVEGPPPAALTTANLIGYGRGARTRPTLAEQGSRRWPAGHPSEGVRDHARLRAV